MAARVEIDERAVYELLNDESGPVGRFMSELSDIAAGLARRNVPVRKTHSRSTRSTAKTPGYTLTTIHADMTRWNGLLYGGVAAASDPATFLEVPAEQDHRAYPFMTTAVYDLEWYVLWHAGSVRRSSLFLLRRRVSGRR